nr:ABC transporter permease subunit [Aureimonas frigidaquae]
MDVLAGLAWAVLSIGLFAGLWELAWAMGWADPLLLPPPHLFLSDFDRTLSYFSNRNQIGVAASGGGIGGLLTTALFTTLRVVAGLTLGFMGGVGVGALVHYVPTARKLLMPTILLLTPISPVAWLPVAIFLFGIGDVPAIFLVFITIFFAIVLSTASQLESVPRSYLNVARIMGANRHQLFWRVVFPSILPGLFMTLRLNLFAAWMVVLIAEAVGVGSGLGQITSVARSTFNAQLTFFTMAVIGVLGFTFDWTLRQIQRRLLWWIEPAGGASK